MKSKTKKIIIIAVSAVLAFVFILNPLAAVIIYESIFGMRYEPLDWLAFTTDDFDSLAVERVDIYEEGERLAGYKYKNPEVEAHGVIVIAHGLGGGGHNAYMPFIDVFTDNGYYVFTYDATGNGSSEGDDVNGLPQGVIDLDRAIHSVYAQPEYEDLPLYLFGHSWGAYSVGSVLYHHPEVKGAVMFSGFNKSDDMIRAGASDYIGGFLTDLTLQYVLIYEQIKFGEWSDRNVLEGVGKTDAKIMIVHSLDDETVPTSAGFDEIYEEYATDPRFTFTVMQNKGHNYLFYSDAAWSYREELNEKYISYVEENGLEYSEEVKRDFMNENLDKIKCFEPDPALMQQIIDMFGSAQ